jgi:hypothetical protein
VHTVQGVAQQVQAHLERDTAAVESTAAAGAASGDADGKQKDAAAELEATKQRVSQLLGALSLKADQQHPAAGSGSSSSAAASSVSAASPPAVVSSHSPLSASDAAETHRAHAAALSSLQRLDASPLTQPLLHSLVKRPPYWGGWLLRPVSAEFWCDGAYRLHSRIVYRQAQRKQQGAAAEEGLAPRGKTTADTAWTKTFLAP